MTFSDQQKSSFDFRLSTEALHFKVSHIYLRDPIFVPCCYFLNIDATSYVVAEKEFKERLIKFSNTESSFLYSHRKYLKITNLHNFKRIS